MPPRPAGPAVRALLAGALALPLALAACDPVDTTGALTAAAGIAPPEDTTTGVGGTVVLRLGLDDDDPVTVEIDLEGLTPGEHGVAIYEGTSCARGDYDGDGFAEAAGAAGRHFNPTGRPHGAFTNDLDAKHIGDLGNVTADANGVVRLTMTTRDWDQDQFEIGDDEYFVGHVVVVHAGRDDLTTQPDGAAGARVGCGILAIPPGG